MSYKERLREIELMIEEKMARIDDTEQRRELAAAVVAILRDVEGRLNWILDKQERNTLPDGIRGELDCLVGDHDFLVEEVEYLKSLGIKNMGELDRFGEAELRVLANRVKGASPGLRMMDKLRRFWSRRG